MRKSLLSASTVAMAAVLAISLNAPAAARSTSVDSADAEYIVLFKQEADDPQATAAIAAAGGTVTTVNAKLGYAVVSSSDADFAAKVGQSGTVDGVAPNAVVGVAPAAKPKADDVEKLTDEGSAAPGSAAPGTPGPSATPSADSDRHPSRPAAEPLADRQWDMQQINATSTGSYAVQPGKKGVLVGIIDTGIDGTHPDIAANFDAGRSRNFVTDIPAIDGPCEDPTCVDPVNVDDEGHGTHVASTVAAPINGLGIAGVAPNVTLVNLRAGHDSGFFFLEATLEALTYAGDIGVDVVNMSYYTDPWLYNCTNNPADTPEQQVEQRVIRRATQRAINYAIAHGVLPIAAEGNGATDLGHPVMDISSPDYPVDSAKNRTIDNSCITVPTETRGVIAVSSTGPSTRKAFYSDYGIEQTDVAAPGGGAYDTADNRPNIANAVLAAYPKNVAEADGALNPDGSPNTPAVVRDCQGGACAYYQYLQGTSMAAPHAVGVAALIVSQFGWRSNRTGEIGLSPFLTGAQLLASAQNHACPTPRTFHYTRVRLGGVITESDATCDGSVRKNGFYGTGIVNALQAVKLF